ncbi:hypothetical protein CH379_015100 [Leptospira ellisii]|uniref:Uncharacterized protein n=1 Tax=Leptospira ellisii TaxID=2023197 RepID=A0AAE4QQV9_9LEPT|nr:hypothetical protein [Leptospira ellisii]MDV6236956.1 hypothetical protein [Leptospira ellisii]PKA03276.1 hypothetical protein CH375_17970 [Leptospira ellisii]
MFSIEKGRAAVFLSGWIVQFLCSSWMNVTGVCPIGTSRFASNLASEQKAPCHPPVSENSSDTENTVPCCSEETSQTGVHDFEFRSEFQKVFSGFQAAVLYEVSIESILRPDTAFSSESERLSVFYSFPALNTRSYLQIFLI